MLPEGEEGNLRIAGARGLPGDVVRDTDALHGTNFTLSIEAYLKRNGGTAA